MLDKLTGRSGKVFPEWEGQVHDAVCGPSSIALDPTGKRLSVRCWRPVTGYMDAGAVWEELVFGFDGVAEPPSVERKEVLPYYEIATVFFDPREHRVWVSFHAGLMVSFPCMSPRLYYGGPTGRRLEWGQVLHEVSGT